MTPAPGPERGGARAGHSLPELIVAVTFLGSSLGVVGATAAGAADRTRDAITRQEAARHASAILDSLLAAPGVQDGELKRGGTLFRWSAAGSAGDVEVAAVGPAGRELLVLEGRWFPAVQPLPLESEEGG